MTLQEMIDQVEINANELGARPYAASPVSAEFDLADLRDQLTKLQTIKKSAHKTAHCYGNVCSLGDWKPTR